MRERSDYSISITNVTVREYVGTKYLSLSEMVEINEIDDIENVIYNDESNDKLLVIFTALNKTLANNHLCMPFIVVRSKL